MRHMFFDVGYSYSYSFKYSCSCDVTKWRTLIGYRTEGRRRRCDRRLTQGEDFNPVLSETNDKLLLKLKVICSIFEKCWYQFLCWNSSTVQLNSFVDFTMVSTSRNRQQSRRLHSQLDVFSNDLMIREDDHNNQSESRVNIMAKMWPQIFQTTWSQLTALNYVYKHLREALQTYYVLKLTMQW